MSIPLKTQNVSVARYGPDSPGVALEVIRSLGGVLGAVSASERGYSTAGGESGWEQDVTATFISDPAPIQYGDVITDLHSGKMYRVQAVVDRAGLGLDHTRSVLYDWDVTDTYTLYRGTVKDQWGDEVPNTTDPEWTGVPGIIREASADTSEPSTAQPNTVTTYEGRLPPYTAPRNGDRIVSDTKGITFIVTSTSDINLRDGADVGVELTRITG